MKKPTNNIHTILLLLILPFLAGCSTKFSSNLREADKMLFTDYKCGEMMLDSIRKAEPNMSTADLQYYKLLKLKADDKAYRPIDKKKEYIDSLVTYFQNAGDDDLLAEAYFYAGRVYFEIGDKPEALKFFQKAAKNVAEDNYAQQGDIYCQMANIYRLKDLPKEAIATLHLAWKADSLNKNTHNMLYDIVNIGETYYDCQTIDSAEVFFHKGLKIAEKVKDTYMIAAFHQKIAVIYEHKKDWSKALFHINTYLPYIDIFPDKSAFIVVALTAYIESQNKPLIEKCQTLILDSCNIFAKQYALETRIASKIKGTNDSKMDSDFKLYSQYTDSIINIHNTEAVKKAEELYNYQLKEEENQALQKKNLINSTFLGILAFATFIIFVYFYMKLNDMKQKQRILQLKLDKYEALKEKAETKTTTKITQEISNIQNSYVYKNIRKALEKETFKLTGEDWEALRQLINQVYTDYDKNLYSFLDVSPQEYKICLLIKIGISPSNIAKFMNLTKEAISASRRRMYIKAFDKKGSPADWDKIISSI